MVVDIVIGTHNRLEMLKLTVATILERTKTPYRLTIIDDASTDGTAEWVKEQGITLHQHEKRRGMHGNLCDVLKLTSSDPVICTDDDALCPKLEPDWLARELEALKARPKLWMLGLNNPGDNVTGSRHPYADDGVVVYSQHVSGHFLAIRRKVLEATPKLFTDPQERKSPNKAQAHWVTAKGGKVGYLKHVYTYHFCPVSIRRPGKDWSRLMITPVDMETLEPPEKWKQCRP